MEKVKSALHQTCERIRKYTTVGTYVKRKMPVRETAIEPLVLLFMKFLSLQIRKAESPSHSHRLCYKNRKYPRCSNIISHTLQLQKNKTRERKDSKTLNRKQKEHSEDLNENGCKYLILYNKHDTIFV